MQKIVYLLFVFLVSSSLSAQQGNDIDAAYHKAVQEWKKSSPSAYPHFEDFYKKMQPAYNKYFHNGTTITSEYKKLSRNYARFMYEYHVKFKDHNDPTIKKPYAIDNGWQMIQAIKGFEALRTHNTLLFETKYKDLKQQIERMNIDIFNYEKLQELNQFVEKAVPNNDLFLKVPSIKDIQNSLSDNEVYVSFLFSLNGRSFFMLKITKKDRSIIQSDKTKDSTQALLNRVAILKGTLERDSSLVFFASNSLKMDMNDPSLNLEGNLAFLQRTIIDKLNITKNQKIIIENDIFASQIPFDILKDPTTKKYLIEEHDISYVPNAEYFLKLRKLKKNQGFDTVLGCSPVIAEGETAIENEILQIKNYFPKANLKTGLSKRDFLEIISKPSTIDIIHLSAHLKTEPNPKKQQEYPYPYKEQLEKDGYKLDERDHSKKYYYDFGDSKLYPEEFGKMNYMQTNLLILSGCETATSDDYLKVIKPQGYATKMDIKETSEGLKVSSGLIPLGYREGCYCNSTESFSNLSLMSLPFKPNYTIAFQNSISIQNSEKFFIQFYAYLAQDKDIYLAFRKTKLDFLDRLKDTEDQDNTKFDPFLIILISD